MKRKYEIGIMILSLSFINMSLANQADPLCSELIKFANGAKQDRSLSVELVTEWGENISTGCIHTENKMEKNFCKYLQNHTSIEFQEINISRALVCIGAPPLYSNNSSYSLEYGTGGYRSRQLQGADEGVEVEITYSFGIKNELPRLKFTAMNVKAKK